MSEYPTKEQCRLKAYEAGVVICGSYRHYKGGRYIVADVGWSTEEKCISVRYISIDHPEGPENYRPLIVFVSKLDDGKTPRFVRYG